MAASAADALGSGSFDVNAPTDDEDLGSDEEGDAVGGARPARDINAAAAALVDDATLSDDDGSSDGGSDCGSDGDGDAGASTGGGGGGRKKKKAKKATTAAGPAAVLTKKQIAAAAKKALGGCDTRDILDGDRASTSHQGFDIEVCGSDRQSSGMVEIGGHVIVDGPGGQPQVSTHPLDHFCERCTPGKGATWSTHAVEVHGVTSAKLKEGGARDHEIVLKAYYDWSVARCKAHGKSRVGLIVHNAGCDINWTWHYQRRCRPRTPPLFFIAALQPVGIPSTPILLRAQQVHGHCAAGTASSHRRRLSSCSTR